MFKFLVATILLTITTATAVAQGNCGPAVLVFETLVKQYGETPAFVATVPPAVVITVTISPTSSWSMVAQQGDAACIISAGQKWAAAPPVAAIIPQKVQPGLQKNGLILIHDMAAMTDPQRDAWYQSLKSNGGGWCCDLTDAAHIDQRYVRQMVDRSWEVFLTDLGKWVSVPPDRVVHNKPSIDGEPYLFRYPVQFAVLFLLFRGINYAPPSGYYRAGYCLQEIQAA